MDPELRRLLNENLAISKNNNEVLRSIRHHQWLTSVTSIIFWVVVVALPIYLYQQYVQPVFEKFVPGSATSTGVFFIPSSADLQKLLESFKAQQ